MCLLGEDLSLLEEIEPKSNYVKILFLVFGKCYENRIGILLFYFYIFYSLRFLT